MGHRPINCNNLHFKSSCEGPPRAHHLTQSLNDSYELLQNGTVIFEAKQAEDDVVHGHQLMKNENKFLKTKHCNGKYGMERSQRASMV